MNCSGEGFFNATLYNTVQIQQRIEVSNQKSVTITGSGFPTLRAATLGTDESSAVADVGNFTGIFLVSGGSTLTMNALVLEGGRSKDGGAVVVLSSSSVHAFDCTFENNNATTGGAISARDSEVHIDGTTRFSNNSAEYGGSLSMYRSEVHIDGATIFSNNFAEHGGVGAGLEAFNRHMPASIQTKKVRKVIQVVEVVLEWRAVRGLGGAARTDCQDLARARPVKHEFGLEHLGVRVRLHTLADGGGRLIH
eukprot:jgi/Undpi1/10794/HiC_scaffold_29.g13242.m1